MSERLALFPLGTVLYPGLALPLHVFEERYRLLVRRVMAAPVAQDQEFGVIAIREGGEVDQHGVRSLYEIGCTALVLRVEPYSDGRFDLLTAGARRFRLLAVDNSQPYPEGEVEFLDEPVGELAPVLTAGVERLFARYQDALRGRPVAAETVDPPDDPTLLSYLVAAALVLDLRDKQALLESPDTAARLTLERDLLRREAAVMRRLPSLPAVDLPRAPVSPN